VVRVAAVDDDQVAHVMLTHPAGRIDDGVFAPTHDGLVRADVADIHD